MKGEMRMRLLLCGLMLCLLLRAETTMAAASAACRLFVAAVLPGLFPYMVLSLMLTSRVKRMSLGMLMLLGWGGGSPTGARLMRMCPALTKQQKTRLAVSTATMSPMFLLGTAGGWLGSAVAGWVLLGSVILGGWLTGLLAAAAHRASPAPHQADDNAPHMLPLPFGTAVEYSARTMLLVCGTMAMLRVFAALMAELLPSAFILPLTTLLEVTTGAQAIAALPLPLAIKTALIAGATGFGGMAIILQNRALYEGKVLPLGLQAGWQAFHGVFSFLIALGMMLLLGRG